MDTWNLGWKLAHVLTGRAPRELLSTYSAERADIAKQLIDFDREWSKMFSSKPKSEDNPDGVDPAEFQKYFELFSRFTAGVGINTSRQQSWVMVNIRALQAANPSASASTLRQLSGTATRNLYS